MDYSQLETYEYKAPSYEPRGREDVAIDFSAHTAARRYTFDAGKGAYTSAIRNKETVSMLFAGDLLCQEKLIAACSTQDGGYDFGLCFEYLKPLLRSADFAAACLKTPVAHTAPIRGEILSHEGPHYHNAPLAYLEALSGAGFDLLTTEGNHCLDAGARGLMETIGNIRRFGMMQTGTRAPGDERYILVDICGIVVGITAFGASYNDMRRNLTPEGKEALLNPYSHDNAAAIYQAMKDRGADYTICFPHWGKEYTETPSEKQIAMANDLTRMGYDLVLGTHPHMLQNFHLVNGKPVAFSLGSLMAAHKSGTSGAEYTALCHLRLKRTETGVAAKVEFIPCKLLKKYNGIPYTIVPVVDGLGLTDSAGSPLARTTQRMVKRLGCKPSRARTDYPVAPGSLEGLYEMGETLLPRVTALKTAEKRELNPEPIVIPQKKFWENVTYVEEKKCLYKLSGDSAELVQFGRAGDIVTLPRKVSGAVVRTVSGSGSGNTTTRLIYLGKSVRTISDGAFRNYTALESVRLFRHLKTIGAEAFAGCTALSGVILPRSAEQIGAGAFSGCASLLSVKIPPSVTQIGEGAFRGCGKLTIYCEAGSAADSYAQANSIPVKYIPLTPQTTAEEEEETETEE